MPEAADEIAASLLVLTTLGISDELGTAVPLRFEPDKGTIIETFTLCGVWEGDTAAGAQMVWFSRTCADAVAPVRHGSSIGVNDGQSTGCVFAEFMLPHSWQLKERAFQIFDEHGLGDIFHYNDACTMSGFTASDLLPVLGLLAPVLAVVELPSAFGCGIGMGSGTRVILPEAKYLRYANDSARLPMMTVFDVDDALMAETDAFVRDYTENVDPAMDYPSRLMLEKENRGLVRMFALVGGALCGLLALIGILNFINSMTTSLLTRSRNWPCSNL